MERTEIVTITNMCMVYREDEVLVQRRVDQSWPGIAFPGGHVEHGEPLTDAVIREIQEETGLQIVSPQLCGVKDWINSDGSRYMVLCYKTNRFSGKLHASCEGEVYWVKLNEIFQMELAQDMDSLLRVFLDETVSEFFYQREHNQWIYMLK